ncbi:MAG: hypothetical protein SGCHY_003796 [Lobulomycetales sp.]
MSSRGRALSYILRHGAERESIPMTTDGYVRLSDLASHPRLSGMCLQDFRDLVAADEKQRYTLTSTIAGSDRMGDWCIRANQGHSMDVRVPMRPVEAGQMDEVLHATCAGNVDGIRERGISRSKRRHVHFIPGGGDVDRLARREADVLVAVDVDAAMRAGIPFYWADNGVVVSPGNDQGVVPSCFITRIARRDEL